MSYLSPVNSKYGPYVVVVLITIAAAIAFDIPKINFQATRSISSLTLPQTLPGWNSEDASDDIDQGSKSLNFLGNVLAREFDKDGGPLLYLFILDAENFHHPESCVGGTDYEAQDLPDIGFKLANHNWKAKAVFFEKKDEGFLTVYWISLNGAMVRMDITTTKDLIDQASQSAQELLTDLAAQIPPGQQVYLFGKP